MCDRLSLQQHPEHNNASDYFNGTIDDVMIFNRSLSADQIHALYINGTQTIVKDETIKGEQWKCKVTPNDGSADGTSLNSSYILIENSLPENVSLIEIANGTITGDNTPFFNWTASPGDDDGDAITYMLQIDNNSDFSTEIVPTSTGCPFL